MLLFVSWLVGLRITTAHRVMRKTVEVAFKGSPAASVDIANRKRSGRSAVRFLPEAGDFISCGTLSNVRGTM